jgi:copper chaperone
LTQFSNLKNPNKMEPLKNHTGEILQFKTNIHCGGCLAQVSPALNQATGINHWEVDTSSKDKILTVRSEGLTASEIIGVVNKAGYKAELKEES